LDLWECYHPCGRLRARARGHHPCGHPPLRGKAETEVQGKTIYIEEEG